jgi:AAA15 family ATPase/GTPase
MLGISGSSVFFPTFRRIEGGFSLQDDRIYRLSPYRQALSLSEAIADYAKTMSVSNHRFISSISTNDVEDLLTREYANVSDRTNTLHAKLSQFISDTVANLAETKNKSASEELRNAKETLNRIKDKAALIEGDRENLLRPFTILSELIGEVFKEKGVKITDSLAFGRSIEAMPAQSLSAGEKQMLSFLCYNAFSRDCVIFIDEPEISLHVDWQRVLVPTLLAQGTNNQFILATHSPMIYSKYPEKELVLDVHKE